MLIQSEKLDKGEALSYNIQLKQFQKLAPKLSLKQWIPLVKCSLEDLDSYLYEISLENPFLEIKESTKKGVISGNAPLSTTDSEILENRLLADTCLYEKLYEQIEPPLFPTPISQNIATLIIEFINEEGYFDGSVEEIAKKLNVANDEVERVRQRFSYLEPAGVGAKNLQESFLFQLNDFDLDDELSLLLSSAVIDFLNIEKYLSHPRFAEAKAVLKRLKSPPAIEYLENRGAIVPDLFVFFQGDDLKVEVNSKYYPEVVVKSVVKRDSDFLKEKFKDAKELVSLIGLRKQTLQLITLSIIEKQMRFFNGGDLVPLKHQQIADELGFSEGTISRAVSEKYLACDRGIFPLSYFFVTSVDGKSSTEIKNFIKRVVACENINKPLSDQEILAHVIERFNISISRRSVTKYRQELGIAPYKDRRVLHLLEEI